MKKNFNIDLNESIPDVMKTFDEIAASLQKFGKRISHEGWRTATLAKLKLDLKGLDIQRKEAFRSLGEKVYEMKRRKSIKDDFLLENLMAHFEEIEQLEKRSLNVLEDIQRITLMDHRINLEENKECPPKDRDEISQAIEIHHDESPDEAADRLKNIKSINE